MFEDEQEAMAYIQMRIQTSKEENESQENRRF